MDPTHDRSSQAESGKLVNGSSVQARQMAGPGIPRRVSVEEGYARWASTYDQTPNPLLALEERCLAPFIPNVAGKNVLDLACGTGRWLKKFLVAKPALAVGIDLSTAMLAAAQKKAVTAGRLARADCLRLPFASDLFDLALCSFAVEHIGNLCDLAAEWARVLKPSADLFITGLHPAAYSSGWRVGFRDGRDAMQIDSRAHSQKEMVAVFRGAGFELVQALEFSVEEPERPFFVNAGKERFFKAACRLPAIMILHFQSCQSAFTST
jgi:SAM-dependent methyltransferase